MNNKSINYATLATLGNVAELVTASMELAGGNEIAVKEVPDMANDVAAIINNELGDLK